jgi:hypothetical protein
VRHLFPYALLCLMAGLLVAEPTWAHDGETPPNASSSILLSLLLPGVGEWYNAGFQGGFPLAECTVGWICPCVHIASIVDGAANRTDDGLRFDFWAPPLSASRNSK